LNHHENGLRLLPMFCIEVYVSPDQQRRPGRPPEPQPLGMLPHSSYLTYTRKATYRSNDTAHWSMVTVS
jgi:hypothetical protein